MAAGSLLALIARRAAWRVLVDPANLNVFLGACVAVLALWRIKAGVGPGLSFQLLVLMAWSEAFISGMLMTVMVVWKPQWVATFSDQKYLLGK